MNHVTESKSRESSAHDLPKSVYRVIANRLRAHAARKDRDTFDLVARVNAFPWQDADEIWRVSSSDADLPR